ncbi:hypothetical protein [Pseudovibrio sp. Ad37]|uniref:hypothetical protein n=1 Tax=Pseudovibrio sp. Ad37 TaxID=989422 RepID=UPI0007AE4E68|nr:hypothetical protein [Pseudovibrio sp. Ad37]KZL20458.1 hypothetical protein PsAD37_03604 [Pseudovibrio sp. Ad37]
MPDNKLSPEQHQWAQKVFRHLQWKFPLVEGDPTEEDEFEDVPLDDVSLDATTESNEDVTPQTETEPDDELTARKKAHDAELGTLYKRMRNIAKSIRVAGKRKPVFTEDDESQDLFEAAKELGEEQIERTQNLVRKEDENGFTDLGGIKAHVDKADQYLKTMQAAYQKGRGNAVEELVELKKTAALQQKRVEDVYKEREPILLWNVDLSAVDKAYDAVQDNFTEMNRAISGYVVSEVDRTLLVAKERYAVLREAMDSAKRYADAAGTTLLLKVSIAQREIQDLAGQRETLDNTPDQQSAFDKACGEAADAAKKANDAVLSNRGKDCEKALQETEKLIAQAQQVLLQAVVGTSELEISPPEGFDEEEIKRLTGDVTALESSVEGLNDQRDLVKNHGVNFPSFEAAYQSARTDILSAQTALLAKNAYSAQESIRDIRDSAADMQDYITEAEAMLQIQAEQIADLRRALEPLADTRKDFERYAQADEKFGKKQLTRFDALCGEVSALIEYAEACREGQRVEEADQAIGNSRNGLKKLEKETRGLQWMPQVNTAATEAEAREMLQKAIARINVELEDYDSMGSVFRDNEERLIYTNLHDKAAGFAEQASVLMERKRFEASEEALDNARITLDSMEIAYERGANTAAKVEGYLADAEAAKDRINAVYEQGIALQDPDHKNDFLSYNSIANDFAFQVEGLIAEGKVRDARAILSNLKVALANLERCVTQTPRKKKKRKAEPAPNPAQQQATDEEPVDPRSAEQAELAQQLYQVRAAINTIFSQARPLCVDEYVADLEAAYAGAMQHHEEGSTALAGDDLESARASLSTAKQDLVILQKIQDNSRQILSSLLNGLSEGAAYYENIIAGTHQKRAEFDAWDIDLTSFDASYKTAQETLSNLRKAIKDQLAGFAKTMMDKIEDDRRAFEEAYDTLCDTKDNLRSDLIIDVSDRQSKLSRLFAAQDRFDGNEALLERYAKFHAMALVCTQIMLDHLKVDEGKEAEKQFAQFDECVAVLEEMLQAATLPVTEEESEAQNLDQDEAVAIGIEQIQRELKSYGKRKDIFKNAEELSNFESMFKTAEAYLKQAVTQLGSNAAQDALENAEITMDSVRIAFERGQRTAAKIEGYQIKVEELVETINKLHGQRSVIQNDDDLAIFLDNNETASEGAYKIESFLSKGKVMEAEVQFGFLNSLIANMERMLKQHTTKKRKGIFKRRGAMRQGKKK